VTAADVKLAAARYLKPSNRTLGLFYPEEKPDRSEIPPPADVAALVKDYKGGAAVAAGEAFEPSPENIERRTVRAVLKNGLKLALLPKKTRGSTVIVSFSLHRGSPEALLGKAAISDLTKGMFMRGTARRGRQQIKDEFDRLKARAYITGDTYLETDRANLAAALRLTAEVMREPAFAESEFETLKQETLARIEEQKKQPDDLARKAFFRHIKPYPSEDIRYTPTHDEKLEKLKAVTLADVREYYRDFYGASSGELAVIGDFDPEEFKALAEELFGNWVSPQPYKRLDNIYKETEPARFSIETPDKANAFTMIGLTFPMKEDHPDAPALLLADYIAGGSSLTSRLGVRIRQKEGLSYSVWSRMYIEPEDELTSFSATAIYSPQNAARIEKAFREELNLMITDGFTEAELAKAKAGWLQARKMQRATDSELSDILKTNEYLHRTMAWHGDFDKKIAALTPRQVQDAFKRHFLPSRLTIVQAGDFAAAARQVK
jgi:zinc protease